MNGWPQSRYTHLVSTRWLVDGWLACQVEHHQFSWHTWLSNQQRCWLSQPCEEMSCLPQHRGGHLTTSTGGFCQVSQEALWRLRSTKRYFQASTSEVRLHNDNGCFRGITWDFTSTTFDKWSEQKRLLSFLSMVFQKVCLQDLTNEADRLYRCWWEQHTIFLTLRMALSDNFFSTFLLLMICFADRTLNMYWCNGQCNKI